MNRGVQSCLSTLCTKLGFISKSSQGASLTLFDFHEHLGDFQHCLSHQQTCGTAPCCHAVAPGECPQPHLLQSHPCGFPLPKHLPLGWADSKSVHLNCPSNRWRERGVRTAKKARVGKPRETPAAGARHPTGRWVQGSRVASLHRRSAGCLQDSSVLCHAELRQCSHGANGHCTETWHSTQSSPDFPIASQNQRGGQRDQL